MATKNWVEEQNVSIFNNDAGYTTTTYVDEAIAAITIPTKVSELENDAGYLTEHQSLADYTTKQELQDAINAIPAPDLSDYALKTEIPDTTGFIKSEALEPYALKTEIPNTSGFITETALEPYALKTEIPSTEGFIKSDALEPYALKSEIPDTKGFITEANLEPYALKSEIPNTSDFIKSDALEPYALKSELPSTEGFIKSDALEPYALKTEIPDTSNFITETALSPYALKSEITEFITEEALTPYALKSEIPNTSNFITETALEPYALKTELPSIDGLATETYVNTKIAEAQLSGGGTIDLSDYALKAELPTKTSQLVNDNGFLTEHQSLAGYATETYVNNAIAAIPSTDLSNYYTKAETDTTITNKLGPYALKTDIPASPDLSGYALKTDIPDTTGFIKADALAPYALKTELPSIEGLATEEYVNNAVAAIDIPEAVKHISITDINQLLNLESGYYFVDDGFNYEESIFLGNLIVNQNDYEFTFIDIFFQFIYSEGDGWTSYLFVSYDEFLEVNNRLNTIESAGYQTEAQVNALITAALNNIPNAEEGTY